MMGPSDELRRLREEFAAVPTQTVDSIEKLRAEMIDRWGFDAPLAVPHLGLHMTHGPDGHYTIAWCDEPDGERWVVYQFRSGHETVRRVFPDVAMACAYVSHHWVHEDQRPCCRAFYGAWATGRPTVHTIDQLRAAFVAEHGDDSPLVIPAIDLNTDVHPEARIQLVETRNGIRPTWRVFLSERGQLRGDRTFASQSTACEYAYHHWLHWDEKQCCQEFYERVGR